jgi:hypothetical protein
MGETTYDERLVNKFRHAYGRASAGGYQGTKAEFARLVFAAGRVVFTAATVEAALEWRRYMDRPAARAKASTEIPNPEGIRA